jgi:hypothetical protein
MKNPFPNVNSLRSRLYKCKATLAFLSLAGAMFAMNNVSAQTTNAYDTAADPVYGGTFSTGQNGGSGFGAWTVTVNGTGGSYTTGGGPSGDSWGLWNMTAHGTSVATRSFDSALVPGQSFSFYSQLNNLFNTDDTNAVVLQDASGNTIFSYWHTGFEANSANGSYSDATTGSGSAVGFSYDYQQFCSFTFTLNSATTYTFADNTTGNSFTGVISGAPIAQVSFVRANGNGANTFFNGGDFRLDELMIVSSAPPTFIAQTPTPGSYSASRTNISLQVIAGGTPVNINTISLKVDGNTVTPAVSTVSATTTISYQPGLPLSAGVLHTVQVTLSDNNNNLFTNTWSFTTGFPSLPATLPGPISDSDNGGPGVVIFNASGDGWVGTNYEANSTRTLWARFSMAFQNLNGESGGGGGFGGLEFYQDNTERSIYGNNWLSLNWSLDVNGQPLDQDLNPATSIVFNEYHTIVVEIEYQIEANAIVNVWLDPDFTQTVANQPNPPVQLSFDNTFDQIHLRCGNGTASATWTNIIMAATSADVGFPQPVVVPVQFQSFVPGINASGVPVSSPVSVDVLVGSYGVNTNTVTLNLDGTNEPATFVVAAGSFTVNYQPTTPFAADSPPHSVTVSVTDSNGTPYSTSWGFTVDQYPALPLTQAGPFDAFTGSDVILYDAQNEWIGGNYGPTSTNTLYTLFSMTFYDLNGETGSGGGFGGLEFYLGNTEHFMIGNNWLSTNWSVSVDSGSTADIPPVTPIVLGESHTFLMKCVYAGTNDAVSVWLDPDLTKTDGNQPNPPLQLTLDNTFDSIHLRAGNGSAQAEFDNIVFAATAQGVGLPAQPAQGVLNLNPNLQLSWTSIGTLQSAPMLTGPWSDSANQANPQTISATSTNQFFRLRQ